MQRDERIIRQEFSVKIVLYEDKLNGMCFRERNKIFTSIFSLRYLYFAAILMARFHHNKDETNERSDGKNEMKQNLGNFPFTNFSMAWRFLRIWNERTAPRQWRPTKQPLFFVLLFYQVLHFLLQFRNINSVFYHFRLFLRRHYDYYCYYLFSFARVRTGRENDIWLSE